LGPAYKAIFTVAMTLSTGAWLPTDKAYDTQDMESISLPTMVVDTIGIVLEGYTMVHRQSVGVESRYS